MPMAGKRAIAPSTRWAASRRGSDLGDKLPALGDASPLLLQLVLGALDRAEFNVRRRDALDDERAHPFIARVRSE